MIHFLSASQTCRVHVTPSVIIHNVIVTFKCSSQIACVKNNWMGSVGSWHVLLASGVSKNSSTFWCDHWQFVDESELLYPGRACMKKLGKIVLGTLPKATQMPFSICWTTHVTARLPWSRNLCCLTHGASFGSVGWSLSLWQDTVQHSLQTSRVSSQDKRTQT